MARTVRLLDSNLFKTANAVLAPDSAAAGLPVRYLLDQIPSKPWRSATGWVIVAGVNDKLDFNRGGAKVATIPAGTYATGADLATAIAAALEAADVPTDWACTYDPLTGKFTISASATFTILTGTGANLLTSIWKDIGFATGADEGPASPHVGDNAVYQSRHWISLDLLSAQACTAAAIYLHNVSGSGTVKLVSSATSVVDALTDPDASQTLTGDTTVRVAYFGSQSHRYVAILIEDQGNSVGYAEVAIAFIGTYRQPGFSYSNAYAEPGEDLSIVEVATEGAHHGDLKPETPAYELTWEDIPEADADIFRAHRSAIRQGENFFLAFDVGVDNTDIVYGYRNGPLRIEVASANYFNASFVFAKALP